MKHLFFTTAFLLFLSLNAQTIISGRVKTLSATSDAPVRIAFMQDGTCIDSTQTTTGGFFSKTVPVGTYDVRLSTKNFKPLVIHSIELHQGNNMINFSFLPVKLEAPGKQANIEAARKKDEAWDDETSYFYICRGQEIPHPIICPVFMRRSPETDDVESPHYEHRYTPATPETPKTSAVSPGQLSSGHWRDLDHWDAWQSTNLQASILQYQTDWGFYPADMMRIGFETGSHAILPYTQVSLIDKKGHIAWQTYTDQDGQAYFWPGLYDKKRKSEYKLQMTYNGEQYTYEDLDMYINSDKRLTVNHHNASQPLLELAFIVDATGSMNDEIHYLQAELQDVITRVQSLNPCLQIMTGTVFYRDQDDAYVTRILPLSTNPFNTISFIQDQSGEGGGDVPEAVDMAMESAFKELQWSDGCHPRLMFMLLDAPPHRDDASMERIRNYTSMAAAKGIRIIPVASSGIDKAGEFLMKYIAIATNGEYMYLTDDSRIGDSHIKPSGGQSTVQTLNDLMVELISKYSQGDWCNQQAPGEVAVTEIKKPGQNNEDSSGSQPAPIEVIASEDWYMAFNPNPASKSLHVYFSKQVELIRISDLNGHILHEQENNGLTETTLDISDWSSGMYVIHALKSGQTISGKLLVMH